MPRGKIHLLNLASGTRLHIHDFNNLSSKQIVFATIDSWLIVGHKTAKKC